MAAHPDVDLIVVCVRVPGTGTWSWPACRRKGRALRVARSVRISPRRKKWPGSPPALREDIVGLQARSDPTILYAA